MLVYDFEQMVIRTVTLPADSVFQPWDSHEAWHGKKVPITLGDDATEFDWGMSTGTCTFLQWSDFFSSCELAEKRESRSSSQAAVGASQVGFVEWPENRRRDRGQASAMQQSGLIPAGELFDRDNQGRTRLFYAAERGIQSEVERMIFRFPGTGFYPQRLSFIESKDHEGLTAADMAEQNGHEEIAQLLRYQAWLMETYG